MRLIDTGSLKLHEWPPDEIPSYAILSHTWTKEEVSFAEYDSIEAKNKTGYRKIQNFCRKADELGYAWGWVDTCCIDKTSSAELSEAINSMYRWYQDAGICLVYLNDVPSATAFSNKDAPSRIASFDMSRWFTRGFTLQELLAPADVSFFSNEWEAIGSKTSLAQRISIITGIPEDILRGNRSVHEASVSQRMSWASERNTTRKEDIAYCLMGIFDINMPMLYGEGDKAFRRLQEEIMKNSSDQTLFAWEHVEDDPEESGLLARHPRNFQNSALFEDKTQLLLLEKSEVSMSNRGTHLRVFLFKEDNSCCPLWHTDIWCRLLCTEDRDVNRFALLILRNVARINQSPEYVRVKPDGDIRLRRSRLMGVPTNVLVRHNTRKANVKPFGERRIKVNATALKKQVLTRVIYNQKYPGLYPRRIRELPFRKTGGLRIGDNLYQVTDPNCFEYTLPLTPSSEVFMIIFTSKTPPRSTVGVRISLNQQGQLTCLASSSTGNPVPLEQMRFEVDLYGDPRLKQIPFDSTTSLIIKLPMIATDLPVNDFMHQDLEILLDLAVR